MKSDVLFVVLAGAIVVVAMRLGFVGQIVSASNDTGTMAGPLDADVWLTPYYLRYNIPPPDYLSTLMPIPANYTYALGVPSAPLTQKAVTT